MFFGTSEVETVDNDIVTLKNGDKITITEKNKNLLTEEAISGSDLQEKWINIVTKEFLAIISEIDNTPDNDIVGKLVNSLTENNIRLVDISHVWDNVVSKIVSIKNSLDTTIEMKNNETIVNALGKDKLDNFSKVFGAKDNAPNNSIRNIRFNDIF